jgi:H+/gluconate symporter-like permease
MTFLQPAYLLLVLLGGFALLTLLVMWGRSIFVAAPLCALLILTFSGADPVAGMTGPFMDGFSKYLRDFYLIFGLGAAFGRLMDESGAARTIAGAVSRRLGRERACLAVVLACAVLTYGGVSLFVVGFSVYPLAVQLFREADLPRRFIPGAISFGSVTFTMTTAGSPEIQNLIPIKFLVDSRSGQPLTDALAGWPASLIVAVVMFALGQVYLEWAIRGDLRRGARFEPRANDVPAAPAPSSTAEHQAAGQPGLFAALAPLILTLLALNLFPRISRFPADPTLAVLLGVAAAVLCLRSHLKRVWTPLGEGFVNGLIAIGATCSVVGFGSALQGLPAFKQVVAWVTSIPGDPLIGAALSVAVIAGIAGSASGGQGLALPILKPIYVDQLGVAPRALHRVVSIASGSLDSLPANGYIVMLIRHICGETHGAAYFPIFVTTVVIPAFGTALAIFLFRLFPAWAHM